MCAQGVGPERRVEASGHDNEVTCFCPLHLASKGGGFEGEAPEHFTVHSLPCTYLSTLDQFLEVFTIGTDFDDDPPVVPGPHSSDLLQIMPWPVFRKMTDREKRAIYEYLRAIPCLPAGSGRCT